MADTTVSVSRFENRNRVRSWRVSGWLGGQRIRKNFKTREEACAECAVLETKALQATAGFRRTTTLLTDEQLRDAESAFRRLAGLPRSLSFYLDYAVAHYREPEREMPIGDAIASYLEARKMDRARGLLSPSMLGQIKWELDALQRRFPDLTVAQLKSENLKPFFERGKPSLKTYNNRRGLVGTFLKFAFQQNWNLANPTERMPHFRIAHRRGSAVTLNAGQCAELMAEVEAVADGVLVPYCALCLFAGIRPSVRDGEISKLKACDINLDTGAIHVEPEVSKVRMKRIVTIQPNLAVWLRAYSFEPINAHVIEHFRKPIVRKLNLTHDVLRHTFISMFVAKFRSMGEPRFRPAIQRASSASTTLI